MLIRRKTAKSTPDHREVAKRAHFARARLLNVEMDGLTADSTHRAAGVTSKASFLAVAAGVMVAASTAQLWIVAPAFGVTALVLACVALVCASVAVRPGKRKGIQARQLVDRFADSERGAAQVEVLIVSAKAEVLEDRESDMRSRATWVTVGFVALALAAVALTVVFTIEILGR